MTKSSIFQLVFSSVVIFLALCLSDFFKFFMPMQLHIFLIFLSLVFFALFSKAISSKINLDEREQLLELSSFKFSYIATNISLLSLIFIQSLEHRVDQRLVILLAASLLSKVISSFLKK